MKSQTVSFLERIEIKSWFSDYIDPLQMDDYIIGNENQQKIKRWRFLPSWFRGQYNLETTDTTQLSLHKNLRIKNINKSSKKYSCAYKIKNTQIQIDKGK